MSHDKLLQYTPVTYSKQYSELSISKSITIQHSSTKRKRQTKKHSLSSIFRFSKSKYLKSQRSEPSLITTEIVRTNEYNLCDRTKDYLVYYLSCFVLIIMVFGTIYCGYWIFHEAILKRRYAKSFDIEGECKCIDSYKKNYIWYQKWKIYKLLQCEDKRLSNYTFSTDSDNEWVKTDEIKTCWTNNKCSKIFISQKTNPVMIESTWLYITSILVFVLSFCCIVVVIILLNKLKNRLNIINVTHIIGSRDKIIHFEKEWNENMNAKQRFDYTIAYWTRLYKLKLNNNVHQILLSFYDDDHKENVTNIKKINFPND